MPFSSYDIDPERIEAMRAAFYRVCDILQLNGERDDPMTEVVVRSSLLRMPVNWTPRVYASRCWPTW
jgi:hypothetical protein